MMACKTHTHIQNSVNRKSKCVEQFENGMGASCLVGQSGHFRGAYSSLPMPRSNPAFTHSARGDLAILLWTVWHAKIAGYNVALFFIAHYSMFNQTTPTPFPAELDTTSSRRFCWMEEGNACLWILPQKNEEAWPLRLLSVAKTVDTPISLLR